MAEPKLLPCPPDLLKRMADDLQDRIEDQYRYGDRKCHPGLIHRYDRDMEPVVRARKLLNMMAADLRACRCGSTDVSKDHDMVECQSCGLSVRGFGMPADLHLAWAILEWNTRAEARDSGKE